MTCMTASRMVMGGQPPPGWGSMVVRRRSSGRAAMTVRLLGQGGGEAGADFGDGEGGRQGEFFVAGADVWLVVNAMEEPLAHVTGKMEEEVKAMEFS